MIQIKRAYEIAEKDDGYRVLVDRLWPRGISKERAHLDLWLKDIAPSTELRIWFGHDPEKWEEFKEKYRKELQEKKDFINQLKTLEKKRKILTLIYGARDKEHNEAIVLSHYLNKK